MPRAASSRLLRRALLLCFAANLFQGLGFHLFLHLPGYLEDLGASEVEVGWIWGIAAVSGIGLRPAIGRAMDRRGRRVVIHVGNVLNVGAIALYLTVDAIGPWVYAVRIAHGVTEAMLFSALFTYAADHVPAERRTQGLALFGVSGLLPIALGGLVGDAILARADYAALFAAALGFAALSLLVALPLEEEPRAPEGAPPSRGVRAALGQRDLVPLWTVGILFSTALTAFFAFIKLFVRDTGIGSVGLFFSCYTGTAIALRLLGGPIPDRLGPKRILGPALAALAGGFFVMATAESALSVGLAGALCGLGHGFTFPILFGLVVTRAPERDRGAAMSLFTALFDAGLLLGGPLFGWILAQAGWAPMFRSAGGLVVAGALLFYLWDARARAPAGEAA